MTRNAKMTWPGEMDGGTVAPESPMTGAARARKRMANICATPEEVELYHYSPNAARDNRHPGIPCEDYGSED